jgi:hypothetical protein
MGFVKVTSLDDEKGYVGDERFIVFSRGRKKYLVPEDFFLHGLDEGDRTTAYRIIRDTGNDTALATPIKNSKSLDRLARAYQKS